MNKIGQLLSFKDFIEEHVVEIPRIQRDYTYGSKTDKTEKVVDKLLSDIYAAVTDNNSNKDFSLILDFIYGNENQEGMFEPLDGQQRLTTLFLLHIYAAWNSGNATDNLKFRYATRSNTADFCQAITDPKKFHYSKDSGKPSDQITDSPFYLPSFNDDPSIRSMLVVLDKIDSKFHELAKRENGNLWVRLTNDCRVKFYNLDFGEFNRSDDLYIKMNSRGKSLTEYEIFKSQLEKYIDVSLNNKDLMYKFSMKFDTDYTDLVWSEMGMDKSKIDNAFICLFRNLLTIQYFKRGNNSVMKYQKYIWDYLPDEHDSSKDTGIWPLEKSDIDFIMDFMDVFYSIFSVIGARLSLTKDQSANDIIWNMIFYSCDSLCEPETDSSKMRIRVFNKKVNLFRSACQSQLSYGEMIMLYAYYLAIKQHSIPTHEDEVIQWLLSMNSLRHIRNLVENSTNELARPKYIHDIMSDVEIIINGEITSITTTRFNTTQMKEEQSKARRPDLWCELYRYENHDILRGSLSIFSLDNVSGFNINDKDVYVKIRERLTKFEHIFDNESRSNDRLIRAALLSIVDFGRVSVSDRKHNYNNRMIGCMFGSWRLLFTVSDDYHQTDILEAIDKFPKDGNIAVLDLPKDDWRYYATKKEYRDYSYVAYGNANYGYYNHKDPNNKPLEVYAMQSSQSYDYNTMYKLLTKILWEIRTKDNVPFISSKKSWLGNCAPNSGIHIDHLTIDISQKGWMVRDETNTTVIDALLTKGYNIDGYIVLVPEGEDYIQFGLQLVDDIDDIIAESISSVKVSPTVA